MVGEDDDLRRAGHGRLQAEARIGLAVGGGDRGPARDLDQLGQHRLAPGDDQRVGPEHVEHAPSRKRRHRPPHRLDPPLHVARHARHFRLAPRQGPDAGDQVHRLGDPVGVDEIDGDAQPPELLHRLLTVALVGGEDEVGAQRHQRLQIGVHHAAHAGLAEHGRRVVAEVRAPHQPVLSAEGEDDLGDARHQRHDALRRKRQRDVAPEHVPHRERRAHGATAISTSASDGEHATRRRRARSSDGAVDAGRLERRHLGIDRPPAARARWTNSAAPVPSPRRRPRSR